MKKIKPIPPKNRQIKEGTFKPIGEPEHHLPISFQQLYRICKCKHYRHKGIDAVLHYNECQRILRELGLTEDQVKQCLHP